MNYESEEMHIMCPPLSKMPQPPHDQPGCEQENCPNCGLPMWVSRKKRLMRDKYKTHYIVKCWCIICLVKNHVKQIKLQTPEFILIDLAKMDI